MAVELFNRRTSNMKKTLNFKLLRPFTDFADGCGVGELGWLTMLQCR